MLASQYQKGVYNIQYKKSTAPSFKVVINESHPLSPKGNNNFNDEMISLVERVPRQSNKSELNQDKKT